jgi:hypothetical protein
MDGIPFLVVAFSGYLVGVFMLGVGFGWAVSLFKTFIGHGPDSAN